MAHERQAPKHRRSVRLRSYDYAAAGGYFVTIVAADRACMFGEVVGDSLLLSRVGVLVEEAWRETAEMRARVKLDEFVVMPNHLHGIVWLVDEADAPTGQGTPPRAPTLTLPDRRFGAAKPGGLSTIINNFKGRVTTQARVLTRTSDLAVWQRGFYERVICNERELHGMREYIVANPRLWAEDQENPDRVSPTCRG